VVEHLRLDVQRRVDFGMAHQRRIPPSDGARAGSCTGTWPTIRRRNGRSS